MPFTAYPTAPDINDPATFPSRATAWWAHHAGVFVPEMEAAMLAFGPGAPYCTTTGLNALVLTSGLNLSSLAVGQRVVFKPPNANTNSSTSINLDGLGGITSKTITGAALPVGYTQPGVLTSAIYDGTNWIMDRLPEVGSNANGVYYRYANGLQVCTHDINLNQPTNAVGSLFYATEMAWTFPAAFSTGTGLYVGGAPFGTSAFWVKGYPNSTTVGNLMLISALSLATNPATDAVAIGRWY